MFRNYLAAALRNMVRNRLYAAINVLGLAVGFAAALLVALFIRDELTYERWIPGSERIFLFASEVTSQAICRTSSPITGTGNSRAEYPNCRTSKAPRGFIMRPCTGHPLRVFAAVMLKRRSVCIGPILISFRWCRFRWSRAIHKALWTNPMPS